MTRGLLLGAALLAGTLLLGGCGPDTAATTTTEPGSARSTSLSQCAQALPAAVVDQLGWANAVGPALESGTCTLTTDDGDLAVQRWPVGAVGGDDLPQAARKAFDERCQDLHGEPAQDVDWVADMPACAVSARRGQNTLLALTPDHTLIEARVYTDEGTAAALVRDALVSVVQAGARTF